MVFKTKYLVVLMIVSVFLLSGCEVYQTLYGTPSQKNATQVIRVEGDQAKDTNNLQRMAYAAASPVQHDLFKIGANPLGPFQKGKPLGFTLGQWLAATGSGTYTVNGNNAEMKLTFNNLVKNSVYTVWCSRMTFPPNPKIVDIPCGSTEGSENSFKSNSNGDGSFNLKLKKLEPSTKETASVVALAYHSDGKTYGASPGDFGLNSHVHIFFLMRFPTEKAENLSKVDLNFVNHIQAGLPEQDVFIDSSEPPLTPTAEIVIEQGKIKEKEEMDKEKSVKIEEKAEETEEKPKEKPVVVIVKETDLVSLLPKAEDPDKNTSLVFTFTSPLNEKGEWQTNYDDAGQYTITVTASDGELTTTRDVLIIVNKKEEQPVIDNSKPIETGLAVDETQSIDFIVQATDLNKDPLTYNWKLDGQEVSTERNYTYQTTYDDSGTHTVKIEVSDGTSSTSKIWSINVKNVNRKPILENIEDIKAKETDKIVITTLATDLDKDPITYSISDKRFTQEDNVFTWQTDFDTAGTFQVAVSASDGQDTVQQTFKVEVDNVNRPPVITDIIQKK